MRGGQWPLSTITIFVSHLLRWKRCQHTAQLFNFQVEVFDWTLPYGPRMHSYGAAYEIRADSIPLAGWRIMFRQLLTSMGAFIFCQR